MIELQMLFQLSLPTKYSQAPSTNDFFMMGRVALIVDFSYVPLMIPSRFEVPVALPTLEWL